MPIDTASADLQSRETWPTVSQAGRLLGCGPQRIRDLITQGRLTAIRGPLNFHLIDPESIAKLQRERAMAMGRKRPAKTGAGREDK